MYGHLYTGTNVGVFGYHTISCVRVCACSNVVLRFCLCAHKQTIEQSIEIHEDTERWLFENKHTANEQEL